MAPEQFKGVPCPATDQYALGVMVYEWLCGMRPFQSPIPDVLIYQHQQEDPPGLCERLPHLPTAVEDVVFRALAKDPQERFDCVADFASDLEKAFETTEEMPLGIESPGGMSGSHKGIGDHVVPEPSQQQVFLNSPTVPKEMRQLLLDRVRSIWITGVLKRSLHGAALMVLGLQEQPDAVVNPWHLHVQHPDMAPRPLPIGTCITQVYDEAAGELLILGAPGAGKTTLLLELARDLLDRAEQDVHHPIPMVFNLSSWAPRQQPIKDWLIRELNTKYQIPRKLGQTLVESHQLLPLLDGLDEVAPRSRTACIDAINTYRQKEHGLLPLVVCSRSADFLAQNRRLLLHTAVAIQPLTRQQVNTYIVRGGEALSALRAVLRQDATLYELISTPLMLSILTLTYHGKSAEDLLQRTTLQERQRQIFEKYVARMLTKPVPLKDKMPQQTLHWLTFLATQMHKRDQTVFYLEQMQPDWLPATHAYEWYAVRLPGILIGVLLSLLVSALLPNSFDPVRWVVYGFIGGYIGGLFSRIQHAETTTSRQRGIFRSFVASLFTSLLLGLCVWLGVWLTVGWAYTDPADLLHNGGITGLSSAMSTLFLSTVIMLFQRGYDGSKSSSLQSASISANRVSWRKIWYGVLVGLSVGLAFGFGTGLSFWLLHGQNYGMTFGIRDGLMYGVTFGLIGILLSIILVGMDIKIHPIEVLTWSWHSLWRSLRSNRKGAALVGLIVGLGLGVSFGLGAFVSQWQSEHSLGFADRWVVDLGTLLADGLTYGLTFGLAYWLLLGLFRGLSSEKLPSGQQVKPNEGIRRSLRIGILVGLSSCIVSGLIGVLSTVLYFGLYNWLGQGWNIGLSLGGRAGVDNALHVGLYTGLIVVGWQVGLFGFFLACALMGGLAWLRHSVLRLILWRSHNIPLNYPRFLNSAAKCILLHKVGGGYKFVHDLLLEHFASLEEEKFP
jgi:hypothetical protein